MNRYIVVSTKVGFLVQDLRTNFFVGQPMTKLMADKLCATFNEKERRTAERTQELYKQVAK